MAKSFCPTLGESLPCIRKQSIASAATAAASSASGRRSISISTRCPRCLGNSPPAIPQSGCKSSSVSVPTSPPFSTRGELDLVIVSNEIREGDGVSLCRERRVWAAGRAMHLDPSEPAPLALYPPYCRWRQLALEELDRAGRPWTLVLQSAGTAGIVAALDAGLSITIFPEFNLPNSLKALGAAEALPALPDFEFVLRGSRNSSLAADHLAEMIINFFQLSTALRPGDGMNYKQRSHLLLRTRLEAGSLITRASGSPRWRGASARKNRASDWRGSSS
jgi:hypothetical protein